MDAITLSITTCEDTGLLVASSDDPGGTGGLTTQVADLSDLGENVREVVAVHFEPEALHGRLRLHFVDDPVLAVA